MATLLNVPRPLADIIAEMRQHESGDAAHAFYDRAAWRALCNRIEMEARSMMVESNAFAENVRSMRAAQREYFKTRTSGALCIAKTIERKVDELLAKRDADTRQEVLPL